MLAVIILQNFAAQLPYNEIVSGGRLAGELLWVVKVTWHFKSFCHLSRFKRDRQNTEGNLNMPVRLQNVAQ